MLATTGAILTVTTIRFSTTNTGNGAAPPPPDSNNLPRPPQRTPLLSVPKPSWIVKSESNVRLEKRKNPEPSCVVCRGSGRVDCYDCSGKGRTNCVELAMLPNGEWPKWCKTCGGSGLAYCSRCLGTGEYRYLMGFHFMKKDEDQDQGSQTVRDQLRARKRAEDVLQNDETA
ncbi:heat shock protein DnaJ, cysteine-rich domain-containing protein [Artemisia annua]|uniref:Heat shock protein DnaJ, cysteine-rich domain-containing protein n=1 Tax=Artemisia annua TaxID=35608 RepID=A0A2U1LMP2_ARTAN|nr:heat shock protein DnaJ, cysteine-rich domain-containing protein [Artemisia annua]